MSSEHTDQNTTHTVILPKSIIRKVGPKSADDELCPICHEIIAVDAAMLEHIGTATNTGCMKRFHEECLISWFCSVQGIPSCPIDRKHLLQPHEMNPWMEQPGDAHLRRFDDFLQGLFLTDPIVATRLLDIRNEIFELNRAAAEEPDSPMSEAGSEHSA